MRRKVLLSVLVTAVTACADNGATVASDDSPDVPPQDEALEIAPVGLDFNLQLVDLTAPYAPTHISHNPSGGYNVLIGAKVKTSETHARIWASLTDPISGVVVWKSIGWHDGELEPGPDGWAVPGQDFTNTLQWMYLCPVTPPSEWPIPNGIMDGMPLQLEIRVQTDDGREAVASQLIVPSCDGKPICACACGQCLSEYPRL